MPSTELGVAFHAMTLQRSCKKRLLEELVQFALARGEPSPASDFPSAAPRRPYFVLVVDALTLRIVNAVCHVSELLQQSIWGVQSIEAQRQALPVLEALYFVTPTTSNVNQLLQDISDPKYRGFHVFFSQRLQEEQLALMAKAKEIASVRSFAEANLAFFPFDERCFHFGNAGCYLSDVLNNVPSASLEDCAAKLATVLSCLPARSSIFYMKESAGASQECAGVCQRLAQQLAGKAKEGRNKRGGDCAVLVVDRSFDWLPLLVHDMRYEALLHDVFENSWMAASENKVSDGCVVDAREALWEKLRFMPVWEVSEHVAARIKTWRVKDEEMRSSPPSSPKPNAASVSRSVSNTLNALHSLPEHQELFEKLQLHSELSQRCHAFIEKQKLVPLGALEQDLLTGFDADGGKRAAFMMEQELLEFLSDNELPSALKTRLLMLFFACADCSDLRKRELASYLDPRDRALALSLKHRYAPKPKRSAGGSPRSARLLRWRPRIREVIEELAAGRLNEKFFPAVEKKAQGSRTAVLVFVLGGVSLTEVRAAQEAALALNIEVVVGGSCILTPASLFAALREL